MESANLLKMQIALRDFIDASKGLPEEVFPDVEGYVTALKRAPQLIESESNPVLFLRCEQGNAIAAARRLLNYWSFRLKIFGPDKAFVPLKEALSPSEVQLVLSGAVTHLPRDAHGRDVFCADLSRRSKGFGDNDAAPSRARGLFYVLSLCFSNPLSQSEGMVFIFPLTDKSTMNTPGNPACGNLIRNALPIKSHSIHLACCPKPGTSSLFKNCYIPSYSQSLANWSEAKNFLKVHVGKTPEDLLAKLEKYGLCAQCVPEHIGGLWKYQEWVNRMSRTLHKPQGNSKGPLKKRSFSKLQASLKPPPMSVAVFSPTQSEQMESSRMSAQKLASTTKMSKPAALHFSAKTFERTRRHEISPLEADGEPIEGDWKGRFSEETVRSFSKVMSQDPGRCADQDLRTKEEKADFLKKRDALYSRRKYYRKKLRIENLISRREDLLTERKKLRAEGKRLEELIEKAKKIDSEVEVNGREKCHLDSKPVSVDTEQSVSLQTRVLACPVLMNQGHLVSQDPVTARGSCHSISDFLRQRKQEYLEAQRGTVLAGNFLTGPTSTQEMVRDPATGLGSTETLRSSPAQNKPTTCEDIVASLGHPNTTPAFSSQSTTNISQEQILLNFPPFLQQLRLLTPPALASVLTGFGNQQGSASLPTIDVSIPQRLLGGPSLSNDNALMILKLLDRKRLEERATSSMLGQQDAPRGLQNLPTVRPQQPTEEHMMLGPQGPTDLGATLCQGVNVLTLLASQGNAEALRILLEMEKRRQRLR